MRPHLVALLVCLAGCGLGDDEPRYDAALAGLALADGPVGLMLAMTVFAAGAALLGVAPAAIVGDVVEGKGGTPVAVWQMASDLGSVLGPLAAGLLIDRASFGTALLVGAGVVLACTLLGLRVPRVAVSSVSNAAVR